MSVKARKLRVKPSLNVRKISQNLWRVRPQSRKENV